MIGLLIFVLVIILILWLVRQIPDPTIQKVALVIVIIVAIIWLLQGLGGLSLSLRR